MSTQPSKQGIFDQSTNPQDSTREIFWIWVCGYGLSRLGQLTYLWLYNKIKEANKLDTWQPHA